jgi:hypothetical protein
MCAPHHRCRWAALQVTLPPRALYSPGVHALPSLLLKLPLPLPLPLLSFWVVLLL